MIRGLISTIAVLMLAGLCRYTPIGYPKDTLGQARAADLEHDRILRIGTEYISTWTVQGCSFGGVTMPKLFVIRHAQVNVDFDMPATQWNISAEGIASTRELALTESWEGVSRIYHSSERKAVSTAQIISEVSGIPTAVADGLGELTVPIIHPHKEFVRRVGAYLAGYNDPEFEGWDEAAKRIVNYVQNIVRVEDGQSVAIVSHGRILSVLFSHILERRVTVDEWQSIRFPDLAVVDLDTWVIERGFMAERQKSISSPRLHKPCQ